MYILKFDFCTDCSDRLLLLGSIVRSHALGGLFRRVRGHDVCSMFQSKFRE